MIHDRADELHTRGDVAEPPAGSRAGDTFPGYRLTSGLRFGPCETVRPLGRGGMGEVWLARNVFQGRDEAVKVLLNAQATDRERERFLREARAAIALSDLPEVVRTYDVDESGGRLYIRMEVAGGVSLDKTGQPPAAAVMPLLLKLARALAAAHARGIIHRDIKPSNFMLDDRGACKLMDFGLARARGSATLTGSGDALGTPAYMSLEQWDAAREADARADVYGLGVTFYQLVTGRLPFQVEEGASVHAYYAKLLTDDPPPIEAREGLPSGLPAVVMKAMAKRAEERFADAGALVAALEAVERGEAAAVVAPESEASRRRRRRARLIVVALVMLAAFAVAGIFGALEVGKRRSLGEARGALADARSALARVDEVMGRGVFVQARRMLEPVTGMLDGARASAEAARGRGADPDAVADILGEVEREATCAAALEQALDALLRSDGKGATRALDAATRARGDPKAFAALRALLGRATRAEALLERARADETGDPLVALGEAMEAEQGTLAPTATAELRGRLESEVARARDAIAAQAAALIATGRPGFDGAERAIVRLRPYPGADADVARLQVSLARAQKVEDTIDSAATAHAVDAEARLAALRRESDLPEPRLDAAIAEARARAATEVRDDAEAALAKGDAVAARALFIDAARRAPASADLRADKARYAAALAAPPIAGRVLVPPITCLLGDVRPFAIDRTEVTSDAYRAFVEAGGYSAGDLARFRTQDGTGDSAGPGCWPGRAPGAEMGPLPVSIVSIAEARAYARWRGGRLPTPEEWAVAAAWSPQEKRIRTFPWGDAEPVDEHDEQSKDAVRFALTGGRARAVDPERLDVSPLGVVGMAGNVAEWVERAPPSTMGGSAWDRGSFRHARASAAPRERSPADRRDQSIGFRCVYDLPEPPELAAIPKHEEH